MKVFYWNIRTPDDDFAQGYDGSKKASNDEMKDFAQELGFKLSQCTINISFRYLKNKSDVISELNAAFQE